MTLYVNGVLGDALRSQMRTCDSNILTRRATVAIGATGAPTITTGGAGIAIVRNSTGNYSLTYPAQAAVSGVPVDMKVRILQSAATTVAGTIITAFAPASGTATFVTYLNTAGTPVDPANGDSLSIEIIGPDTNG